MKFIVRLLIISFSILLILLSFEAILRKYHYKPNFGQFEDSAKNRYIIDDKLIYSLRPNTYTGVKTYVYVDRITTNNLGFRGIKNVDPKKRRDSYRVVIVGDSFTEGFGLNYEHAYPSILENLLNNQKIKRQVEIINAAIPGYSPDQQYRQIVERIIPLSPDLIIWNLISYDILDSIQNVPALYDLRKNNDLVYLDARLNWYYLQNYLFVNTPQFIKNFYTFDFLVRNLRELSKLSRKSTSWAQKKILAQIDSVVKMGHAQGFNLLVVRLPVKEDFEDKELSNYYNSFFSAIKHHLVDKKISYLDIKEILGNEHKSSLDNSESTQTNILGITSLNPKDLFFSKDIHPNEKGAKAFAELLKEYMIDNKILEEKN